MKLIRNLLLVLVGLSLAVLIAVLLLAPSAISQLAASITDISPLVRLPLAVIVVAIVLALLYFMLRADRVRGSSAAGLQVRASGTRADVSIDSARTRILKAVRDVSNVTKVDANVQAVRGRADVELDVVVAGDAMNIPNKQREIERALRQVINKQLGLQMAGKPQVHIRFEHEDDPVVATALPIISSASLPVVTTPPAAAPITVTPETDIVKVDAIPPVRVDTMTISGISDKSALDSTGDDD